MSKSQLANTIEKISGKTSRKAVKKLAIFFGQSGALAIAPLLISIASVISVPVILSARGESFWVSVAVGQALGEIGRAVTIWGYGGRIAYVSSLHPEERARFYEISVRLRGIVFVLTMPILCLVAWFIPVSNPLVSILMVVAGCTYGLGASWMFVATSSPKDLVIFDALPRGFGIAFGAFTLLFFSGQGSEVIYGAFVILGGVLGAVMAWWKLSLNGKVRNTFAISRTNIWTEAVEGLPGLTYTLALTTRLSLPVTLVPILVTSSGAVLALGDKLLRWLNTGFTPIVQLLQTKVLRGEGTAREMIRRATWLSFILGTLVALVSTIVIPVLSNIVGVGQVKIDLLSALPLGIALGSIALTTVLGLSVLPMLESRRTTMPAALVSVAALLVFLPILSSRFGEVGAFWALALAEIIIATMQSFVIFIGIRLMKS